MIFQYFNHLQCEEIELFVRYLVRDEFTKLSEIYKREEDRIEAAKYVDIKTICKHLNVSRQTIHNWEIGKVSKIDITPFVIKKGRFKMYDLKSIHSLRNQVIDDAERWGSTRFSKR